MPAAGENSEDFCTVHKMTWNRFGHKSQYECQFFNGLRNSGLRTVLSAVRDVTIFTQGRPVVCELDD